MDLQRVIVAGHESGEARDDEIAVARMQVVFGMVVAVVAFKRTGVGVQRFGQIGLAVLAM